MPKNQLNSLPLLMAQQFVSPDDGANTVIYASHVLKYWSPSALGITAGTPAQIGGVGYYYLTSPWLNLSPCDFFVFVLNRDIPGGDAGSVSSTINLCKQYKQTPADLPPPLAAGAWPSGGWDPIAVLNGIKPFPAQAGPATQRRSVLLSPNTMVGSSTQNVALCLGPSVRFTLMWLLGPAGGDHSTYSLAIWGSSS
jgi:hypothetical protein